MKEVKNLEELLELKNYKKDINKNLPKTWAYDSKFDNHRIRIASVLGKLNLSIVFKSDFSVFSSSGIKSIEEGMETAVRYFYEKQNKLT